MRKRDTVEGEEESKVQGIHLLIVLGGLLDACRGEFRTARTFMEAGCR